MSDLTTLSSNEERVAGTSRRPLPVGELLFAIAGMVAGVVVIYVASGIRIPPGSTNTIGPREFPYAVAVLLILSSFACLINALRGKTGEAEDGEDVDADARTDWLTVGVIALLFVVFALLIQPVGWAIAVTVLFAGTAIKLGTKRWWMAIIIGLIMGLLTQYLFGTLLGISLPAGPLIDWIPIFNG